MQSSLVLLVCLFVPILLAKEDHHHRLQKHLHIAKHLHRGLHQKNNALANQQQSSKALIANRDESPNVSQNSISTTSAPTNSNSQVDVYFLQNATMLGYYNASAQFAALFNYSSPQVLVIGPSSALYFNATTQTVTPVNLALSEQQDFQSFFVNLPPIASLVTNQQGQAPSQSQIEFLTTAGNVVDYNTTNPIASLVTISQIVIHDHDYSIRGILEGYGQFNFIHGGGAQRFAASSKGHEDTFNFVQNGVQGLYGVGGTLDIPAIMNADNGVQGLVRILLSIKNSKLNSTQIFSNPQLNDPQTLLGIAILLSGNENRTDVDRTLSLVYTILEISKQGGNLNQFLSILEAFANDRFDFHPLQVLSTQAYPVLAL